jgi:hypothetical protein
MNSGGNMNQSLSWNERSAQQRQGQGYGHQGFELGVFLRIGNKLGIMNKIVREIGNRSGMFNIIGPI